MKIKDILEDRTKVLIITILLLVVCVSVFFFALFSKGFACIKSPLLYGVTKISNKENANTVVCQCDVTNMQGAGGNFQFTVTPEGIKRGPAFAEDPKPLDFNFIYDGH